MLVHAVDEVRHPADARLEKRDPETRVPVEHAARDERRHRRHLVEREAHAVDLDVVRETVDTDLRQVQARGAVDAEGHLEVDGGGVERIQVGMVEVPRPERGRNHRADEAELLRAAERGDGLVDPLHR